MLIAATRCQLIQMLRSALTCTNGCSCWSPDEENSPRNFPYHRCALPTELGGKSLFTVRRRYCSCNTDKETCTSGTHQHTARTMIADRSCIDPANAFLNSSLRRPTAHAPGLTQPASYPDLAGARTPAMEPCGTRLQASRRAGASSGGAVPRSGVHRGRPAAWWRRSGMAGSGAGDGAS